VSYHTYYDREAPPRVSFRGRDEWRPPHHGYWAHGDDWWPVGYRRYHRYYYHCEPGVFVYSGWGSSWYDPWWSGPYWWPSSGTVVYRNTYNSYTYPLPPRYEGSYEYPAPPTGSPYYQAEPWMDAELRRALADVAAAWTTGDIRSFQAHLTPGAAVAVRYEWEQEQPWVLAPPVLLDIVSQALQGQRDSRFRFVQAQQMESGLVWAVAEHWFRPENEPERVEATQEYMFRRHDQAWLVEAVTARPQRYWWLASAVLDDAAAESRRLIEEMDRARAQEPGR
jgi:hypothetical protein